MASEDGDPAITGQTPSEASPLEQEAPQERLSAEAVQVLYEVYAKDLLAFLVGVLRDGDTAEEVVQTTYRRLLEAGHEARPETIKGWLFKVAFHEAMAVRRRQAVDVRSLKKLTFHREVPLLTETSYELLVLQEDITKLKRLLSELPLEQQHIVRERIYEEKTFAVIAQELNVPLGTVLTRMRLAMEKLQKWWGRDTPK